MTRRSTNRADGAGRCVAATSTDVLGSPDSATVTTTALPGGEFVDDIAVERCVAGTLPGGVGMSQAEKEIAVVILRRRGYPTQEILRRVGVTVAAIRPILRRHGRMSDAPVSYQLAVPPGCTPEQARRVRLLIASRVHDHAEVRELLVALGLVAVIAAADCEAAS
jgi:hypothetical protein